MRQDKRRENTQNNTKTPNTQNRKHIQNKYKKNITKYKSNNQEITQKKQITMTQSTAQNLQTAI